MKTINPQAQQTHTQLLHAPDRMQWLLCLSICVISLIFAVFAEQGRLAFRYEIDISQSAEYWRLFTAHFVHLGWSHFLLNIVGFVLVWFMYGGVFKVSQWLVIFLVSALGISLGFVLFDPDVVWYVGLSGVLHALLSAGLVYLLLRAVFIKAYKFHWEDAILLLGLVLKLGYEQWLGPIPLTQGSSGGTVIVNAHLYGALMGCFCAAFLFQFTHSKSE